MDTDAGLAEELVDAAAALAEVAIRALEAFRLRGDPAIHEAWALGNGVNAANEVARRLMAPRPA